jgi:hypothetical protein
LIEFHLPPSMPYIIILLSLLIRPLAAGGRES